MLGLREVDVGFLGFVGLFLEWRCGIDLNEGTGRPNFLGSLVTEAKKREGGAILLKGEKLKYLTRTRSPVSGGNRIDEMERLI